MKGYEKYDKNTIHLPRQCSQVMARIGMNSAELGQIGVIGLKGHYGFTTNEEGENKGVFLTGSGKRCLGGVGAYPFNDSKIDKHRKLYG